MDINGITLYPEMNAKIKDILRLGNDPACLYAAARIEQLEKELEQLKANKAGCTVHMPEDKQYSGLLEE